MKYDLLLFGVLGLFLVGTMFVSAGTVFGPARYDVDRSCKIELREAVAAMNDYNRGILSKSDANAVVNTWDYKIKIPGCGVLQIFSIWNYDLNKDCKIDFGEAVSAILDADNGNITEEQAKDVARAWLHGDMNPTCEA